MTLEARIRDVLGRLQMIAEGSTIHLDPDKGGSHASESQEPPGVSFRGDGPPKKHQVSLYEWYRWHFAEAAGDRARLEALYLAAEVDYRSWRFRVSKRVALKSGDLVENDPRNGGAAEQANAKRIVEWYESVPAATVAMLEGQTEAWVKKARAQNGRDPKRGLPRPEFLDMDEEDRRRVVTSLAATMGQKRAAMKLGVDRNVVRKYWPASAPVESVAA